MHVRSWYVFFDIQVPELRGLGGVLDLSKINRTTMSVFAHKNKLNNKCPLLMDTHGRCVNEAF